MHMRTGVIAVTGALLACSDGPASRLDRVSGETGGHAAAGAGQAGAAGSSGSAIRGGSAGSSGGTLQGGAAGSAGHPAAPASGHWTRLDTCPGGRCPAMGEALCAWTGSRWLGYEAVLQQGWVFDPATGQVSSVPQSSPPAPRLGSAGVTVGDRAWLWGGYGVADSPTVPDLGDGAMSDSAWATWTPLASTGAPSPRHEHVVVSTGEQLIVWGGRTGDIEQGGQLHNDGARWTIATDSWSPMSSDGAPDDAYSVRPLWLGHELLFWTGTLGSLYNPTTDTWRPVNPAGAPYVNSFTGLWTGSRALLWGLTYGPLGESLPGGAIYDPSTDSWSSMSSDGGLPYSGVQSSLWTGSQMVVTNSIPDRKPGHALSFYDAAADRWTPAATEGDPLLDAIACAAWDGHRVLVWGFRFGDPPGSLDTSWSEVWSYEP